MMRACLILVGLSMLPATAPAQPDAYGRVFFTARERALLEDARRNKVRAAAKVAAPRPAAVAPPPPPKPERPSGNVTLNGIVRRSDGEATIWVNGVAMPADAQTGKVQVAPTTSQSGVIRVPNAADAPSVELKVGQKLDLSSGNVTERYANRAAPRATPSTRAPAPSARPRRRSTRDEQDFSEER